MPQTIVVPPPTDVTIKPAGGTFTFSVTTTCNICFGTATPPGSFPDLENQTFQWQQGSAHSFPIPPNVGDELPYNTSSPGVICKASRITDTGKVIVVGSGGLIKRKKKPAPKKKKAAKKSASKKAPSKSAAKRKAAPKKKSPAKKKATAKKAKKATKPSRRKR